MTTGDLKNNLRKLKHALKAVKYSQDVDFDGLARGDPASFLPIYHYALTEYSTELAKAISACGIELYGKTDTRFVSSMYKIFRDVFNFKPLVTKEQFFGAGFVERKVIMCADALQLVHRKHLDLAGDARLSKVTKGTKVNGATLVTKKPISSSSFPLSGLSSGFSQPPSKISARSFQSLPATVEDSNPQEMPRMSSGPGRILRSPTLLSRPKSTGELTQKFDAIKSRGPASILRNTARNSDPKLNVANGFDYEDTNRHSPLFASGDNFEPIIDIVAETPEPRPPPTGQSYRDKEVEDLRQLIYELEHRLKLCEDRADRNNVAGVPRDDFSVPTFSSSALTKVEGRVAILENLLTSVHARLTLAENRLLMLESQTSFSPIESRRSHSVDRNRSTKWSHMEEGRVQEGDEQRRTNGHVSVPQFDSNTRNRGPPLETAQHYDRSSHDNDHVSMKNVATTSSLSQDGQDRTKSAVDPSRANVNTQDGISTLERAARLESLLEATNALLRTNKSATKDDSHISNSKNSSN